MSARIALVNVWFGPLPFWMPALLHSCRFNPDVDWLIFTDQSAPASTPENVKFFPMDIDRFNTRASAASGYRIRVNPSFTYKLCDLKMMSGLIFEEELKGYDFWGCCDLDVIWGNLRHFLTEELLANYDVISARPNRISGHFTLFRNQEAWNNLFRRVSKIQERVEDSARYWRVDEDGLSKVLQWYQLSAIGRLTTRWIRRLPLPRVWWERVWTTSGKHQRLMLEDPSLSMRWCEGRVYGANGEEMMYLHFHQIRKFMKGTDIGPGDAPREFYVSPAGIYLSRAVNSAVKSGEEPTRAI